MRGWLTRTRRLGAATAIAAALTTALAPSMASAVSPTSDPEVELRGNVSAGLNQATRVADEDTGRALDIQFSLQLRNRPQLDDLIRRVSTKSSPEYGHYLAPAQFRAQFGPTAAAVEKAVSFLQAGDLTVTAAAPGSPLIDARGSVAAVERALHTSIGRYREASGREFFANDAAPALPASIASTVVGVVGLDNRHQLHRSAVQPRVCPPTCGSLPYTPNQVRTAYQMNAAPLAALTGSGQKVGLFELDDFRQANLDAYDALYGLPALTPLKQAVAGGPTITNGGELEVELDIELMHAIAPGAQVMVFEGPNSPQTDVSTNDTYRCMVDPALNAACPNHASLLTAASNSTSWGSCESAQLPAETAALSTIFAQAAAQGQSFFAASGDNGAHDCTLPAATAADPALAVDSPASDPNVTGVGGTSLQLNTDSSINLEVAWSKNPNPWNGSGGGASTIFSRPSWQVGPGVDTSAGAKRQMPDIALDADPNTGYSIYSCTSAALCTGAGAGLMSVAGTSAAAPAWAAFTAVYNQYSASQAKPALGFANPTLYQLAACPQAFQPFNDVTAGGNRAGTATGYSAGPNYDMVTGLGTLRASDLAQDITGPVAGPQLNTVAVSNGSTAGGTTVSLSGCGFVTGSTVTIDGTAPANTVHFVTSTSLTAKMPAHTLGSASITVVNPNVPPSNSVTFTYVPPVLVAGVGTDNTPYYQVDRGGWTSLGGRLIAAPAVVSVPNGYVGAPLYIGVGMDHDLVVRTSSHSWQRLGSSSVYCIDNPAATLNAGILTVACQGGDHGLYRAQAGGIVPDVPPVINSSWTPLGGFLTAGPAIAAVPGRGVDIMVIGTGNNVYEYYGGSYHADGFFCNGHAALAINPGAATSYFACNGVDRALWWSENDGVTSGGNWFNTGPLGGGVMDGPAIAVTNLGPTFYVEGVDGSPYERGLTRPYMNDGGAIKFGAAAAALF